MFWFQEPQGNPWNPFTHLRNTYTIISYYFEWLWFYVQNYFWHGFFVLLALYFIYKHFLKKTILWICQKYERYCEQRKEAEYAAKYHKNPDLFSSRISAQQAAAQKLQEKYYRDAQLYKEKIKQKEAFQREDALKELDKDKGPGHSLQSVHIENEFKGLFEEDVPKSDREDHVRKLQEKYNAQAKEYQEKIKKKEETKRQEKLSNLTAGSSNGHRLGNGSGGEQKKAKSLRPEYNPLMGSGGSNYRPAKKSKCPGGSCG